jgi:hypothetical protein
MSRLLRLYEKKRGHRRTGSTKLGSLGEALFFSTFLTVGLGGLIAMLLLIVWPEWRANRHFVETSCKVLDKKLDVTHGDNGQSYRPDVHIEYQVSGKPFNVVTYDATRMTMSSKTKADAALAQFEVGKQYSCWYDPMNPNSAVIVRGYSGWMYLLLLIPLSFMAIGGGGLAYTLLHWGTSAERRASLTQRAANLNLLNEPDDDGTLYPNIPEAGDLKNSPGTKLAYRLPIATATGWALFGTFVACVVCNVITWVFVVRVIRSHLQGQPEWFLTLVVVPFVAAGLWLVYALVRQFLLATGIGPTRVEVSQHPLHPGEHCELLILQAGRLTMNALEVLLVCEEYATYRQGTDTRTEQREVYRQQVFRREGFSIDQTTPFEAMCQLVIPHTAMHSFKSEHNEVRWKLLVKGNVAGWPDYDRGFPVIVYPAGHRETKA